jgi:hypothetical protein
MRTLVAGAPCSGKTTVARLLRVTYGQNAVDCDDEIARLNAGTWPGDFDTKNHVLIPKVLHDATISDDILLFNSYTPLVYVRRLRRAGFRVLLLDVCDEELLRRHALRLAEEGWTNVQWFDTSKASIEELRSTGWIDHTITGSAPPHQVAAAILTVHSAPAPPARKTPAGDAPEHAPDRRTARATGQAISALPRYREARGLERAFGRCAGAPNAESRRGHPSW